jgi:DNA-binding NtrC family response regulator
VRILSRKGITALQASSLQEGRELYELNKNALDLVISDWNLKGEEGDGVAFLKGIREANPRIKLALNTAEGEQRIEAVSEDLAKQDIDVMRKPIELHTIGLYLDKMSKAGPEAPSDTSWIDRSTQGEFPSEPPEHPGQRKL